MSCDMAGGHGGLHESSLNVPVIEVVNLPENSSSDETVNSLFDREPDASNNVDENESEDGDDWSLYEDTLDALEDQEMLPSGKISLVYNRFTGQGLKTYSGYLYACGGFTP